MSLTMLAFWAFMDKSNNSNPDLDLTSQEFQTLVEIVSRLRGPNGCPWDKEQTQKSLTQYAIEEAFELVEAIEKNDQHEIKEELGDFLFQVILQAQVARDHGHFSLLEVIKGLNEKMIRRHPHVFQNVQAETTAEVWKNWDKLKAAEKSTPKPVFSYPVGLPALQAAYKIGGKTKRLQFDWQKPSEVFEKVKEEIRELEEEMNSAQLSSDRLEHEIGDVLFSVAQLARHLNLEPEQCLRTANRRFETRFLEVLRLSGVPTDQFTQLPASEKEELWKKAKALLASSEET
jgi:tetrapyrrole methylase family protein/MazG family protein